MTKWRCCTLGCALFAAVGCDVPVTLGRSPDAGLVRGAQQVLYTDLLAGPTSGGENGKGTFLSIFGTGFGGADGLGKRIKVFVGGVEVSGYRTLGPSLGRADVQQLTVQVGALGQAVAGSVLPIDVRVDGRSSNLEHTFTVQPGDVLFVDSVSGDDAAAQKNDVQHPWRHLQTPTGGGALGATRPGDVVVLRGTGVWSDTGVDNRWVRFPVPAGSEPTGAVGTGYLTVMAYPDEVVRFVPPAGTSGGLHGYYGLAPEQTPHWVVISGLRVEGGGATVTDSPINLQTRADRWRVVNNDVGPWSASPVPRTGGVGGNGFDAAILGNRVHDIGGGSNNHCIGIDSGAARVEVGFNELTGCRAGSGVQLFDSSGTELVGMSVHHNLIHDTARYGVLVGDGTVSATVRNNVIYDTDDAAIRISQAYATLDTTVEHNTVWNPCRTVTALNAAVVNTWQATEGAVRVRDNLIVAGPQSRCTDGYANDASDTALSFSRNLWFGLTAPRKDTTALAADPQFVDAAARDFHLKVGSPAIDAALDSTAGDDFAGTPRTTKGADVGAYEVPSSEPLADVPDAGLRIAPSLQVGCSQSGGSLGAALWAALVVGWAARRLRLATP